MNGRPRLSVPKSQALTDEEVGNADKLSHLLRAGQGDRNWTQIFHLLLQQQRSQCQRGNRGTCINQRGKLPSWSSVVLLDKNGNVWRYMKRFGTLMVMTASAPVK